VAVRAADGAEAGLVALEGTLRDFSLADILQLIALQSKTGLLTLKSAQDTVTLGFMEGRLVSAESAAKRIDTRLGTVLMKTGRLSADSLAKALETQGQTLQRLGYILLKSGYCSAADLKEGLEIQIRKIVYALFRWTDGDYVFDQADRIDYDHEFVTPIMVESLLMEGARMIDEWPIVEKVVPSTQIVFQRVPVAQPVMPVEREDVEEMGERTFERRVREKKTSHGPVKVSEQEWAVYSLVDGHRTVAEVIDQTFLSEFDGCKAFYDLVSRGLIEQSKRKVAAERHARAPVEIPLGADLLTTIKPVFLALVLVAIAVFAVQRQKKNTLNLLPVPFRRLTTVEGFQKSVSLLRLRRLTEAVDTFYLTAGKFPDSMDVLVNANLLSPADLLDPMGQKYRYILQGERYYLVGFDQDGKTDIDLLFTNNLRVGGSHHPAKSVRSRTGREIIVIQ
jgi:hypothetical protein